MFPTGAIPFVGPANGQLPATYDRATIPTEFHSHLAHVSSGKTLPQLAEFTKAGGDIIAIGTSTALAQHWRLPLGDHLVDGANKPLPTEKYYVPGSILQVRVNNTVPLAYGLPERVDVMMDESPVFRLHADADKKGIMQVAWFDSDRPLRSGWAWGEDRLYGGTAVARAELGAGTLTLFGPEILHRAQPHGTFKFFFNALFLSNATSTTLGG